MESLVSVIMPNYNGLSFIKESIQSVVDQDYLNWELLVVDDNSSDESLRVVQKFNRLDKRVRLLKNTRAKGAAGARNTGLDQARGEFVAFLDNDDIWHHYHLSKRIKHIKESDYQFTHSLYETINESGESLYKPVSKNQKLFRDKRDILTCCNIGCLTAIYNFSNNKDLRFPEDFLKRQDYAFWLKLLDQVDGVYLFPEITAKYRLRKNSLSSNKINLLKYNWAIYRKIEKFSVLKSSIFFGMFLFRTTWKKLARRFF